MLNLKYNYCEFQVIFQLEREKTSYSLEQKIIDLGAKRIGALSQEEEFWIAKEADVDNPNNLIRIRHEDNEKTYLSVIKNKKSEENNLYYQLTQNKIINEKDIENYLVDCKRVAKFHKKRIIFIKEDLQINIEKIPIPELGFFINFTFSSEDQLNNIKEIINSLNLDIQSTIKYGFYSFIIPKMKFSSKLYHYVYDILGSTAFGASAAILSILGLMIAVYAAVSTKIAILTSILSLALADSLADTYALYSQKKMSGYSTKRALKFGFSNFFSRFILTASFIMPFLFLDTILSIVTNLILGFTFLIFLNLLISFFQETKKAKTLIKSILFSLGVLFGSYFVGTLLKILF